MGDFETSKIGFISRLFFGALTVTSIIFTALFFAQNLRFEFLDRVHPLAGLTFSVIVGLLAADVGALFWIRTYLKECRSHEQVHTALVGVVVTITMAIATTIMGVANVFVSAELVPNSWYTWVGLLIIVVLATEFLLVLFFTLFEPTAKLQRAVTVELAKDAAKLVKQTTVRLKETRPARVSVLADDMETHAERRIQRQLAVGEGEKTDRRNPRPATALPAATAQNAPAAATVSAESGTPEHRGDTMIWVDGAQFDRATGQPIPAPEGASGMGFRADASSADSAESTRGRRDDTGGAG